jgi:hypothetical protein
MENFDVTKKNAFLELLKIFNPGSSEWEYALDKLREYGKEYLSKEKLQKTTKDRLQE